jgi:UPF0271 protein
MDLNCDAGESAAAIADGTQEAVIRHVTSVNIACGAHAGDVHTIGATIEQAIRWNAAIGAHPGYPDRAGLGRAELRISQDEISELVFGQVSFLDEFARRHGARIVHVKPHGALYNQAARDVGIARAIATGVARWSREVILVGLAGSAMLDAFREAGFTAAAEAFADRRYEPDGSLRPRKFADALITDPATAAEQALSIAERFSVTASDGSPVALRADTICIHSDTPGAPEIAEVVAARLRNSGIELRPLSRNGV